MKETLGQRIVYRLAITFARVLFQVFMPVRVHGDLSILDRGPAILYSNHIAMLDPFLLGVVIRPRRAYMLAKAELFKNPILAYWVKTLGAVEVDRGSGDLGAVKKILSLLGEGKLTAIYPEGTRVRNPDGSLGKFQSGGAMIALRSGVPLIPVYVSHGNKYKLFHAIDVYIGRALDLSGFREKKIRKEDLEIVTNLMIKALMDLRVHGLSGIL